MMTTNEKSGQRNKIPPITHVHLTPPLSNSMLTMRHSPMYTGQRIVLRYDPQRITLVVFSKQLA